jgi:hypothetical protein
MIAVKLEVSCDFARVSTGCTSFSPSKVVGSDVHASSKTAETQRPRRYASRYVEIG